MGETDHAVELGPLVALRLPLGVLRLARAELAEVLGGLGDDVLEELKGYTAEGRPCPSSIQALTTSSLSCARRPGASRDGDADPRARTPTPERYVEEDTTDTVSLVDHHPPSLLSGSASCYQHQHFPSLKHARAHARTHTRTHTHIHTRAMRPMHMHRPPVTYFPQHAINRGEVNRPTGKSGPALDREG